MVSDICTTRRGNTFGRIWKVEDTPIGIAGQPRRFDEASLAADVGFGTGDARIKRKIHDRSGEDDVLHRIAESGDNTHGQHEQRESHDGVGDAADDAIGPATEESGGDAGQSTHQEYQCDRRDGDEEIEPRRDDDAAEYVTAELVGAEPMMRARRLERLGGVAGERIVRHDRGAENSGEHNQYEQRKRKPGDRIFRDHIARVFE